MTGLLILAAALAAQAPDIAELRRRVSADSNDALLHYQLGVALASKKRQEEARASFQQAVEIDPKFVDGWIALYRQTQKYDGPPFSLVYDPRTHRYGFLILEPKDSVRRMLRRITMLDPLVDVDPKRPRYPVPAYWEGTMRQAMRAYGAKNWSLAKAWFDTIVVKTSRPNKPAAVPPVVIWYRAMALLELGHPDTTVHHMELLLDAAFRDSTTRGAAESFRLQYALAYVQHRAGNLGEAARIYRVLLEDQLGMDIAHAHLASVLEAQGLWDQAVAERRNATNANPDDPSLIFDLGVALQNAGHSGEAEEVLHRALAANPRETRAYFVLGAALQAQGKTDQARDAYRRFVELSPRRYEALIADAQRRLGSL